MDNSTKKLELISKGVKSSEIRKIEAQATRLAARKHAELTAYADSLKPAWLNKAKQSASSVRSWFGVWSTNIFTAYVVPLIVVLLLAVEFVTITQAMTYLVDFWLAVGLSGAVLLMLVWLIFRRAVLEHSLEREHGREYLSLARLARWFWRLIVGGRKPDTDQTLERLDSLINLMIAIQVVAGIYVRLHGVIEKFNGQNVPTAIAGLLQSDLSTVMLTLLGTLGTYFLLRGLEHIGRNSADTYVSLAGTDGLALNDFLSGQSVEVADLATLETQMTEQLLLELEAQTVSKQTS